MARRFDRSQQMANMPEIGDLSIIQAHPDDTNRFDRDDDSHLGFPQANSTEMEQRIEVPDLTKLDTNLNTCNRGPLADPYVNYIFPYQWEEVSLGTATGYIQKADIFIGQHGDSQDEIPYIYHSLDRPAVTVKEFKKNGGVLGKAPPWNSLLFPRICRLASRIHMTFPAYNTVDHQKFNHLVYENTTFTITHTSHSYNFAGRVFDVFPRDGLPFGNNAAPHTPVVPNGMETTGRARAPFNGGPHTPVVPNGMETTGRARAPFNGGPHTPVVPNGMETTGRARAPFNGGPHTPVVPNGMETTGRARAPFNGGPHTPVVPNGMETTGRARAPFNGGPHTPVVPNGMETTGRARAPFNGGPHTPVVPNGMETTGRARAPFNGGPHTPVVPNGMETTGRARAPFNGGPHTPVVPNGMETTGRARAPFNGGPHTPVVPNGMETTGRARAPFNGGPHTPVVPNGMETTGRARAPFNGGPHTPVVPNGMETTGRARANNNMLVQPSRGTAKKTTVQKPRFKF